MEKEYNRSPQEVLEELGSCPTGLTAAEAAERLAKHGPNKLKEAEKPSLLQRFLTQLKDPMLLILMAAAAVSAVTNALSGESFTEVFIILVVVLLNAVLGVVQESKAEAAIEALQTMTAAKCKVLRDGHQVVIESSQLVPGDVVLLEAGDAVPADGRLLESASMKIEEAALTGESVPVTKAVGLLTGDNVHVRNFIWNFIQSLICKWHTDIFCLTAINTAAKSPAAIFVGTVIYISFPAEKTFPAKGFYIYRYSLSRLHFRYSTSNFFHDSNHLMADCNARNCSWNASVLNVKVTGTNAGKCHLYNGILFMHQHGFRFFH